MLTIITALFNNLELTKAFWQSLLNDPPNVDWEIIWIDDFSTDGTREWLNDLQCDKSRVILNKKNKGFAASNNAAAIEAKGKVLCFLNNDIELTSGWFEPMFKILIEQAGIGIVGNTQIVPRSGLLDHAGVAFDLVGDTTHPEKGDHPKKLRGSGSFRRSVTAACWLVRKEVFRKSGGFDTVYLNGYEDVDLCLRLSKAGYKHWVSYESKIYHHVSASRKLHGATDTNLSHFLIKWGELTSQFGQQDWPREYIKRILRHPTQINATKTLDALLRLVHLKHGPSEWATKHREKLIAKANL